MKYAADFETTTDPTDCRVWAFGLCEINETHNFIYSNSLDEMMTFVKQDDNILYFHNLKFDGEFVLVWLFENGYSHVKTRQPVEPFTFTTLISSTGQFYSVNINHGEHKTLILDSLKIIPFSVDKVAKSFNLPLSKLEIDYKEKREPGHKLTDLEVEYLKADCEIVSRALLLMFTQGHDQMTQGSNALHDYKRRITAKRFNKLFPVPEYDSDIRQSYKGGFTQADPRFANKDIGAGIVLDVNSLYPAVMYYNKLPYGEGIFFEGKYEKESVYDLHVQMIRCQFELKEGFIPTIQYKNPGPFSPTEYLKSSLGEDVTLCLTDLDLEIFIKHYDTFNLEYISGWKFKSTVGLFKEYIDYWFGVKVQADLDGNNGMRTLAKLMLNALYGKFALNPNVRSKYPYYSEGAIRYTIGPQEYRKPIYIPMGTFITAGARYKTITSAQSVYDRFMYADTDSLHLLGTELPKNLDIDKTRLGAWKHEATFTRARYIRAKTYIEEINGVLKPTCAGMPKDCYENVTWENFIRGSTFDGKLVPKHVPGGIVLAETEYTIRP